MYILGGVQLSGTKEDFQGGEESLIGMDTVLVYDTVTGTSFTFNTTGDSPAPRFLHTAVIGEISLIPL